MQTYYFGRSVRISEFLLRHYNLQMVFSDFFIPELYTFCVLKDTPYTVIQKTSDMDTAVDPNEDSLGVSYCYTRIFKEHHIQRFTHGIWNIHPGALPLYRGKHPIEWAFYRNEPYIGITIHTVAPKIDTGYLLAQEYIERLFTHSLEDIEYAVESAVINGLFNKAYQRYCKPAPLLALSDGVYDEAFTNIVQHFVIGNHTQKEVLAYFKIQQSYFGVEYEGKRYFECLAYNPEFAEHFQGYTVVSCSDNTQVAIK